MSLLGVKRLKEQIWPSDIGDRPQILRSEFDTHSRSTEFVSFIIYYNFHEHLQSKMRLCVEPLL